MAIICNSYPEVQISTVKFVDIQREIGGLMSSLRRGSPPCSSIPTGLKGLPLWYAKTKRPITG